MPHPESLGQVSLTLNTTVTLLLVAGIDENDRVGNAPPPGLEVGNLRVFAESVVDLATPALAQALERPFGRDGNDWIRPIAASPAEKTSPSIGELPSQFPRHRSLVAAEDPDPITT